MKIGVIDYEAGNLRSVETALGQLESDYFITGDPEELRRADRIIFPGVGEAKAAMGVLQRKGFDKAILDFLKTGKLLLGICIGCQILLDLSEERETPCLGVIPGTVRKFPLQKGFKIPHMGWNEVLPVGHQPLFEGIPAGASFYFVHSYYPEPADAGHGIGKTDYIVNFYSALQSKNVFAVQFHPEKSGEYGLRLLMNFLNFKD